MYSSGDNISLSSEDYIAIDDCVAIVDSVCNSFPLCWKSSVAGASDYTSTGDPDINDSVVGDWSNDARGAGDRDGGSLSCCSDWSI